MYRAPQTTRKKTKNPAPPDEPGALYMVPVSENRELFAIPMSGANLQGEQVLTRKMLLLK